MVVELQHIGGVALPASPQAGASSREKTFWLLSALSEMRSLHPADSERELAVVDRGLFPF
jgi:hypothetical protein